VSEAVVHAGEEEKQKGGAGSFLEKTRAELDKTSFPSSNDVKSTTIIVVVSVLFFALYLFLIDRGWVYVIDALTWVINKVAGA